MRSSRWLMIASCASIFVVLSLYTFTDLFHSQSKLFSKELEYYDSLRFITTEYSISDFESWLMNTAFELFSKPSKIRVSKIELREIVAKRASFGLGYLFSFAVKPSDLCYDKRNLVMWILDLAENGNENFLYWWSPK